MRKTFSSAIVLVALFGCKQDVQRHDLFYGSTQPPIVSITIGDVQFVKPIHKSTGPLTSPSMISPNRLAVVNTVEILKGQGVGQRIGLAYEAGRKYEPLPKHRYVFLWDPTGKCIQYYPVQSEFYIKDGREIPLKNLQWLTN
ncbi:MAG: hypothetical protein ACTHMT_06890 [Verrucomicrobiota bacterium]